MLNLTKEQILQNPANFLYLFADEQLFLQRIDAKSASIIRAKKSNQQQVLVNAVTSANYNSAIDEVRTAFTNIYGMSPEKALVTLANGGEVAGKNWAEGIYGVGAVKRQDFVQNTSVKVSEDGTITVNGTAVQTTDTYGRGKKGATVAYTRSYTDDNGNTFTAQYNKLTGKYYALSYTTKEGEKQNADGKAISNADSSTIWCSVIESFQSFIEWLVSLFTGGRQTITASNTLPTQQDGFVQESGTGWYVVAALAVGALLYGMPKVGKKNRK